MADDYYSDKLASLKDIFSAREVRLEPGRLVVDGRTYPIVDDVIVLLDPAQYPRFLRDRIGGTVEAPTAIAGTAFAEDIQFQFGECWKRYSRILPEHEREFFEYFDIVDLHELKDARVCDLGCGMGRWSLLLDQKAKCRELVLVDFSEAIFVARGLLKDCANALFFMGDLTALPFRPGFADFLFSLGVLHHLPVECLDQVRRLRRYSDRVLVYLFYALDNRPWHFRAILACVTPVRLRLSRIRNRHFRAAFTWFGVWFMYLPCIWLGKLLKPCGLSKYVPIHDEHHWVSLEGLGHHVYDRFFTRIEQRVSRTQILALRDTYSQVTISDGPGYWHFLCVG
jgi:SAM-dependent methyltransferase